VVNSSGVMAEITHNSATVSLTTDQSIWEAAQQALRGVLNAELFALWFAPVRMVSVGERSVVLAVPNEFCEVWLRENYLDMLQNAVTHAAGRELTVEFKWDPLAGHGLAPHTQEPPAAAANPRLPAPPRERQSHPAGNGSVNGEMLFNAKNTFDTFVVGSNNSFAHAAARAVADEPGKSYNPLFLYGGVGLGKTHLLHAIGQHVTLGRKPARVAYLSSEQFTNEYIDAIQNNQLMRFRKKYRQMDVLLIDDIQFLAGKERIQEEFFHTFNALHEAHRQIVMTSDRPAGDIKGLEHRLVSRFEWGLVTDMQPPDLEMRLAILRKKEASMGVKVQDEIHTFLATRIRSNIRRLEGALIRVASYSALTGKPLTLDVVEGLLRDLLSEEGRQTISIELIQKKVAEHYDIRLADMTSKRRPENIAFPRQVAMYLARQLTDNSLMVIGETFGGRDHGTVMHACRLVKGRMEVDPGVRQTVAYLEKHLLR